MLFGCERYQSGIHRRRATVLIYTVVTLPAVIALISLAVDFGRAELTKTELQRCADASALGVMTVYQQSGYTAAVASMNSLLASNPVDAGSGITPTLVAVGGIWTYTTPRAFTTNTAAPGVPAVKITVSRTKANNNAFQLPFASVIGMRSIDISATAIATLDPGAAVPVTIQSTANSYLAGMPAGSVTSQGDTAYSTPPYQVTGIPVTPGSWITLTGASGTTSILPGTVAYTGADGDPGRPLHHNQNYDGSDYGIGAEDGIADAIIPADAVVGLFLDNNAPNTSPAPATIDWTQASQKDQPSYSNLKLKQPFMIGDGKTSGGTVQRFQVPPGATRFYLNVWDGVTSANNGGSITATINTPSSVHLVK